MDVIHKFTGQIKSVWSKSNHYLEQMHLLHVMYIRIQWNGFSSMGNLFVSGLTAALYEAKKHNAQLDAVAKS